MYFYDGPLKLLKHLGTTSTKQDGTKFGLIYLYLGINALSMMIIGFGILVFSMRLL